MKSCHYGGRGEETGVVWSRAASVDGGDHDQIQMYFEGTAN